MKNKLFFLISLISLFLNAQHPDLQTNRWIVTSFESNGVIQTPVYHPVSFPFTEFKCYQTSSGLVSFGNYQYNTSCFWGFTGYLNFNGVNSFSFSDIDVSSISNQCSTECNEFMQLVLPFFTSTSNNPFSYVVINNPDATKTLKITNSLNENLYLTNSFFTPAPDNINNVEWFMTSMNINGQNYLANSQFPMKLEFNPNNYEQSMLGNGGCNTFLGNTNFFYDNETQGTFYIYDYSQTLMDYCVSNEAPYFSFYNGNIPNPFTFTFDQPLCGCSPILMIQDVNGFQIYYNNPLASTTDNFSTKLQITPNPTSDYLEIKNSNTLLFDTIEIINQLGQVILTSQTNKIDVSELTVGVYLLQIKFTDGTSYTQKWIKN